MVDALTLPVGRNGPVPLRMVHYLANFALGAARNSDKIVTPQGLLVQLLTMDRLWIEEETSLRKR